MTEDFRVSSRNSVVFVVHCRHATQNAVTTLNYVKETRNDCEKDHYY